MANIVAVTADITTLDVGAIVNAANTSLFGGSGVCGAIFDAAGYEDMEAACKKIGYCEYGEAVVTPGFRLSARHVIHTVGPVYGQHGGDDPDILTSCYRQSLRAAEARQLESIAFPLISTGIYGYPKHEAVSIALEAIRQYFEDTPESSIKQVVICAYSDEDWQLVEGFMR